MYHHYVINMCLIHSINYNIKFRWISFRLVQSQSLCIYFASIHKSLLLLVTAWFSFKWALNGYEWIVCTSTSMYMTFHTWNHCAWNCRFPDTQMFSVINWQVIDYNKRYFLTHSGRDEIDGILLTTFSNAFSLMEMYKFRLRFHWGQGSILHHWFR